MRRCYPIVAAITGLLVSVGTAQAATVTVDVRSADGKPLAGAVVIVDTPRRPAGPIKFDYAYEMAQQNIAFTPHVLIVPIGSTVTFPNRDKVRHHVYSFSKPKKFDLKLYGKDESRSILFDKAGVVALGCNIHDAMSGFVLVVETPYAVQTDTNGRATITGVPAGAASVRIWHPTIGAPTTCWYSPHRSPLQGIARPTRSGAVRVAASDDHAAVCASVAVSAAQHAALGLVRDAVRAVSAGRRGRRATGYLGQCARNRPGRIDRERQRL